MTARQRELFSPRLSPEQVKEIRRLGRQALRMAKGEGLRIRYPGFTQRLAATYGVTTRCIQLIIAGKRQTGKKAGRPKTLK
jgi:hypothetical protein